MEGVLFRRLAGLSVLIAAASGSMAPAAAANIVTYGVYCANNRIAVEQWDLAQMIVRNGSDTCQFGSFSSHSGALSFAEKNFGGKGKSCSCR
jgi:hypothetical protein